MDVLLYGNYLLLLLLQQYFKKIDPLGELSEKDFSDEIYNKSQEIEPRSQKPPKFVSTNGHFLLQVSHWQVHRDTEVDD